LIEATFRTERDKMAEDFVQSDTLIIDLLRTCESLTVADLAAKLQVTATAVRQRLNRLLAQQYVERTSNRGGRGRPSHSYRLSDKGRKKAGSNLADLAFAVWQEVRAIQDPEQRHGLLRRIATRLATMYSGQVNGQTVEERMRSVAAVFSERHVPLRVESNGGGPTLKAITCPYPSLADADRTICAMERMMYSQLLQQDVHQVGCRLDGEPCCTFQCS
jgi:predicted ArsR family transcriptional regulator